MTRVRKISGSTGHLMREGGTDCLVDGVTPALDIGLRKPAKRGRLVLVFYTHRNWIGWVREDRITPASTRKRP